MKHLRSNVLHVGKNATIFPIHLGSQVSKAKIEHSQILDAGKNEPRNQSNLKSTFKSVRHSDPI
jgi:hypothetical protein